MFRDCLDGVVPDCHGVAQNGSGSSSVTSPALVLVETPNESVCGGTVVSTKMNGLLSHVQKAWCHSASTPPPSAGTVSTGFSEVIVVVGGCERVGGFNLPYTECYDPVTGEWKSLAKLPEFTKSEYAVCALRNDILVS
ncbi:hypothetical protein NFI96_001473, partial [Prochilodus magdalenae]